MNQTTFAGLTSLTADDNLYANGAPFLNRDRVTIDHFLEIGAVTHRHDGHAALASPSQAPTLVASASGGALEPGLALWFGYTLFDSYGGETAISPYASAATPAAFPPPVNPPTAVADYTAGQLQSNTYYYAVTLVDGLGGETTPSPNAQVVRQPGYASGRITISGLTAMAAASPGAQGWRIYRSIAGNQWAYVASGGAATNAFIDDGTVCADCTLAPPITNTTAKTSKIRVTLPGLPPGTSSWRLYGGTGVPFTSPSLIAASAGSGGVAIDVLTLAAQLGSPPPISLAKPGANLIDPDTELLAWSWKRPQSFAGLSSGAQGDVRMVTDQGALYGVLPPIQTASAGGAGWTLLAASGVQSLQNMALASGWMAAGSGYGVPRAYRTSQGLVSIEGVVGKASGVVVAGEVLATLPVNLRPPSRLAFEATVLSSSAAVRSRVSVDVAANGQVIVAETPSSGAVSLSPMHFLGY